MSEEKSKKKRPKLKIESDLPIRTIGIENKRENKNYGDYPPQRYIHVWWTRKPTAASRLGILASVLPEDIENETFLRWMGINPNNKKPKDSIANHVRKKWKTKDERDGFLYEHYGYKKTYKNLPNKKELDELQSTIKKVWGGELPTILDATAGGGSIPFESIRYKLPTIANELNPVASVILKSVLIYPRTDDNLSKEIRKWGEEINQRAREELSNYFPHNRGEEPLEYLWAHTIECPDCGLTVPLTVDWWLNKESKNEGLAVKPVVNENKDKVSFKLVNLPQDTSFSNFDPSEGTASYGKVTCPKCKVVIDSDEVKNQAEHEGLGYQLYGMRVENKSKVNKNNRGFRTPNEKDIKGFKRAEQKVKEDPNLSGFLSQQIPPGEKTDEPRSYGIKRWRDLFSPRQLLVHYKYWQAFEKIKPKVLEKYDEKTAEGILTFLAITADKALTFNNRQSRWVPQSPKVAQIFDQHNFAFKWSFAESNLTAEGLGYEWALDSTVEVYEELRELSVHSNAPTQVFQNDAANLPLASKTVQAIVMDPPYYDNVMFSELSDFFYIWLKKYLEDIYPKFFSKELTEKEEEAVMNLSKFENVVGKDCSKKQLAKRDYERKMTDIFDEMYRVLDDDGIFTLMFTHKKTEAWDTLTKALIQAGFVIKTTCPISTERPDSLHQKNKNAIDTTIFLASEKRDKANDDYTLWEDVKNETKKIASKTVQELDESDIEFARIDMILASFGPALQVFSENYPVIDDEGNEILPETALDEARSAVRRYLIEKNLTDGVRDADPISEWYILSWLVFEAERFPYDEANRLGKGVGVEIDDVKRKHRLWRKKSNDIVLRSHDERVQTPSDKEKSRTTKPIDPDALTFENDLDKVHAVMYVYDSLGVTETQNYIKERGLESDRSLKATFEALLRVIPHTHDDWEILRDMALTDIGKLLDIEVEADVFKSKKEDNTRNARLTEYE